MIFDEEIRLFGIPSKVTIPGKSNKKYLWDHNKKNGPILTAGETYMGFVLAENPSWMDIYLCINTKLYCCKDFCAEGHLGYSKDHHPISNFIMSVQIEPNLTDLKKILLHLYKKVEEIQSQLDNKADRE